MIDTLIIEDEPRNAAFLSNILQMNFPELSLNAVCDSKQSSVQYLRNNPSQLIFMDVQLKDGNSFEIFKEINLSQSQIIFVTAYDQYAIQAIKFSALDYVLKPYDIDELVQAVEKAKLRIQRNENPTKQLNTLYQNKDKIHKLALPAMDGHTFVNIEDVSYLQSEGAYTTFHMKDKTKYLVSRQMKDYEELFEENGFFRVHQSYIINLSFIKKYIKGTGGTVLLENGKEIDVAVRRKEEFLRITRIH